MQLDRSEWPRNRTRSRIAFDDPRSPFNGCRREVTFAASTVRNGGGATIWYTDPYGRGARAASFTGGVKQYVSAVDNTTQGVTLAAKILAAIYRTVRPVRAFTHRTRAS